MVTMQEAIRYLFPSAVPGKDFLLTDTGGGAYIDQWNLPDPQPTPEQLATVTQEQVKAATTSLYPYELLDLITDDQLIAIQQHSHPIIVRIRTKLQTIVSPMPMAGEQMQQALGALVLFGIITQEQAEKLTRGESLN